MIRALLYLRGCSLLNLLRTRARRLRQPKYLFGLVAGILYFWFFFFRHWSDGALSQRGSGVDPLQFIFAALAVLGLIRIASAWLTPTPKPSLDFSEPEIAFLFPAPATRRQLVHFKLVGTQITILLSSLLLTLLTRRGAALGGNALTHAVGWWLMLSLAHLHNLGAAFTVARLIEGGMSRTRRQVIVGGVIVLVIAGVAWGAWTSAPEAAPWMSAWQEQHTGDPLGTAVLAAYIREVSSTGIIGWLLLPFRIALGPFFAPDTRAFLQALGPALLLLAAHYFWVMRNAVSFEEASIAAAEKRAVLVAKLQAGQRPLSASAPKARQPPFPLRPGGGPPEIAFLWKNLLSTHPWLGPRALGPAAVAVLVLAGLISPRFWFIPIIAAVYFVLLGPQLARQDLRNDLANADLLKSYPLPGWRIVLGQLLAPTAILSGMLWLALLALFVTSGRANGAPPWLTAEFRLSGLVCLGLLIPPVCLLQLLVPNAGAVLFPSWAQASRQVRGGGGIEVMGQRLIFVAGQMLVLLAAVLPAGGFAMLAGFAASLAYSPAGAFATGAVTFLLALGAEIAAGIYWLGHRFERFDLSAESVK
jgi:ABC-2 type transport system permease protein